MIKCEITEIEICGPHIIVMAELTNLIKGARERFAKKYGQESADDDIRQCIRIAFMEEKEIERELEEKKRELMKKHMKNLLESVLKDYEINKKEPRL